MRAIAMAHPTRMAQLPDLPTVAEQGFPGFESNSWFIYFAAGGTPAPILDRLNEALVAVLREPAVRANLTQQGVEVMGWTRAETTAFVARETAKYTEAVRFSGATVD